MASGVTAFAALLSCRRSASVLALAGRPAVRSTAGSARSSSAVLAAAAASRAGHPPGLALGAPAQGPCRPPARRRRASATRPATPGETLGLLASTPRARRAAADRSSRCRCASASPTRWPSASASTAENASAGMYELLSGLVAAEEATRGQLSAELHDTAAQSLMLARSLLADVLGPDARRAGPARAGHATTSARPRTRSAPSWPAPGRPPCATVTSRGPSPTCATTWLSRYGLMVALSWPREPYPLSLVSAITVYRFFQEALLNVVKHADGDEAWATLEMTEQELTATVVDDGPGFDPALVKPDKGRHVGLGLLRERARLAGGSLTVSSTPGGSTTLCLRLPRNATQSGPFGGRLQPCRGAGPRLARRLSPLAARRRAARHRRRAPGGRTGSPARSGSPCPSVSAADRRSRCPRR